MQTQANTQSDRLTGRHVRLNCTISSTRRKCSAIII